MSNLDTANPGIGSALGVNYAPQTSTQNLDAGNPGIASALSNIDWAALYQMQQAGLTADDVRALAAGQNSGSGGAASTPAPAQPIDWAALAALQAAGLNAQDVQALAANGVQANTNAGPGGSSVPANSTANQIGADTLAAVQKDYPTLAWMLNIPELSQVIIAAAQIGLSSTDTAAKIQATSWWQSQSTQAKSYFSEEMSGNQVDAQNQFNAQQAAMQQTFAQLGINPTNDQLQTFTWESLVNGWSSAQALQAVGRAIQVNSDGTFSLASYYTNAQGQEIDAVTGKPYTPGSYDTIQFASGPNGQPVITGIGSATPPAAGGPVDWAALQAMGAAGLTQQDIMALGAQQQAGRQPSGPNNPESQYGALTSLSQNLQALSKQYLVNVSSANIGDWVRNSVTSGQTAAQAEQAFQSYLQTTAISQYPWMQQGIQQGQTPLALVSPYAQMVSNELGVDQNNIDWTQPQWSKLLSTPDLKTGTPTQNPIWQATQQLRADPTYGWSKTPGAVQAAYSFVQGMQETMGQRSYAGQTPGEVQTPATFGSSGG